MIRSVVNTDFEQWYSLWEMYNEFYKRKIPLETSEASSVRGQGIAQKLIDEVFNQAKKAGSPSIYWMTHETNETARKLYDKVAKNTGFLIYRKA